MIEALAIPKLAREGKPAFNRFVEWVVDARSHRVLCLLMGLWLINGFDVALTVIANHQGMLDESNPIARRLLLQSPYAVLAYKVILVTFASVVLMAHRTRLMSEIAAAGMLVIYTIVALQWRLCYELYILTHVGDIRTLDIDAVNLTTVASRLAPF